MPYQVLGVRTGAAVVMMAWSRSAMERSGSGTLAIAASTAASASALFASAFSSRARSRIAARSSAVKPEDALAFVVLRFAAFWAVIVSDPAADRRRCRRGR
jgi:hypothetical protein